MSIVGIMWAASALAAENAALAPENIETIVVTARRREETHIQVPITLSTITDAHLAASGAPDISDIQRYTPNLTLMPSRGTNSTLTTYIRGIGQQDPLWGFEPGVGLYVDDVYIARPQGALLEILNIDRIEVLKGPQGTLYGRNTIGGAVKVVTRHSADEDALKVTGRYGSYGQAEFIASGGASLTEALSVSGSFGLFTRRGYGENIHTGAEANNKDNWAAQIGVLYRPSDLIEVKLTADRTVDNSNANHGHREAALPALYEDPAIQDALGSEIPADAFLVLPGVFDTYAGLGDDNKVISQGVHLSASFEVSDQLLLKSISAYRDGVTKTRGIDFDGTPAPILDVVGPGSVYDDHQFSQELQLQFDAGRFSGVAGVYYLNAVASGTYDTVIGLGAAAIPGLPTPNFSQGTTGSVRTRSFALYSDVDMTITDRLTLSAGLRWTSDDKRADVYKANYLGLGSPLTGGSAALLQILTDYRGEDTYNELTPQLSLRYHPDQSLMVYTSYSRGFKSGGFDMRGDATATPSTTMGYAPETVDSYEVGFKYALATGSWVTAALYQAEYRGQQIASNQVNAAGTGLVSFIDNVGSSRIRGGEIETSFSFSQALRASLSAGYTSAKFKEYLAYSPNASGGFSPVDVADERSFPYTPKWNIAGALMHSIRLESGAELATRIAASYRSSMQIYEVPNPLIDQPGYTLLDASVTWTDPEANYSIALIGRNLGNKKYRTGGYNFPGDAYGNSIIGFYGPPRTITLQGSISF